MGEVIVVGGGLAGLSAAFRLTRAGRTVRLLEARPHLGGRTASWTENGMKVESGLHRVLGFYAHLPRLMRAAGIDPDHAIIWEDQIEIRLPDGPRAIYGASLPRRPLETLWSVAGPNGLCSTSERAALAFFLAAGLVHYVADPRSLDTFSVYGYARRHGVSRRAIKRILVPLTEGIFFLPPKEYSAYVLFGLLAQGMEAPHRSGIGAFAGGMTEILADPIAAAITRSGSHVERNAAVTSLLVEDGAVHGVRIGARRIRAGEVILAASLASAQKLVGEAFGRQQWNRRLLDLPTMPAATIQLELERPASPVDRATFAPGTLLTMFSEQSRTTFRHSPGRLSVILSDAQRRIRIAPEQIFAEVCSDAPRVGIDLKQMVRRYRVVTHPDDFYSLSPGSEALRPRQRTPIRGLTLAGDYTKQEYLATMEGAVVSGRRAAALVLDRTKD
jgi:15-cis-phytoene desaturase